MLPMPSAKERCIGSTARKVAITFGMAAINVNQIAMNIATISPGKYLHCLSQLPGMAIFD